MHAVLKKGKTPSAIMAKIIQSAMSAAEMSTQELAKRMNIHANTIYSDMKDPEKIPQNRLWLYFVALDIPVQNILNAAANSFAISLTER